MASKGEVDSRVGERRLRPVYDWLDAGNHKKALQEVEKVLKKQPNFLCAKALKALALLRSGRFNDSSKLICSVRQEVPTDDATLQVLNICYRDIEEPQSMCDMYEAATKKEPTNEDLLFYLFMSYVRIGDYKKQQKTAMMLFKLRPKNLYYFWAVMSIVMQATSAGDKLAQSVVLPLAERMVSKFVQDGCIESEQEVQLYLIILEKQGKLKEILEVVDGPLGRFLTTYVPLPTKKAALHKEMGNWKESIVLFKGLLRKDPDRWNYYQDYLTSVLNLSQSEADTSILSDQESPWERADASAEQCVEFLRMVVQDVKNKGKKLRGPYLAFLELCSKLRERNLEVKATVGNVSDLIAEYFEKFGDRSCCASDLKAYIHLVQEDGKEDLIKRLSKLAGLEDGRLPETMNQMQQYLSSIQIRRMLGAHAKLSPDDKVQTSICLLRYFQHGMQFNVDPLPTDFLSNDGFVIVMAHLLIDAWLEKPKSSWMQSAILLLEHSLLLSPSNFHFKLLLLRCYHLIGAGDAANKVYQSLDVKHMQLDSMGHLHCDSLLTTGEWRLVITLFDITLRFSSANYKDSVEFIIFAYKFGTFVKIEEFVQFRERLKNSLHYVQTTIERVILYTLLNASDKARALEQITGMDNIIYSLYILSDGDQVWDKLQDNRDLGLILNWSPPDKQVTPELVKASFEADKCFLRLRTLLLQCVRLSLQIGSKPLAETANHIVAVDGESALSSLQNSVQKLQDKFAEASKNTPSPVPLNVVSGPLPSRLHGYLVTNAVKVQIELFLLLIASLNAESESTLSNHADGIIAMAHEDVDAITEENLNAVPLFKRRELLERVFNSVEMLRLSSFICGICADLKQPSKQRNKETNKQKGKKKQQESSLKDVKVRSIIEKVQSSISEEICRLYSTLKNATAEHEKDGKVECSEGESCSPADPAALLLSNAEGAGDELTELCVCMRELVLTNNNKNSNHAKGISVDVKAKIEDSYASSLRSIVVLLEQVKCTQKSCGKAVH